MKPGLECDGETRGFIPAGSESLVTLARAHLTYFPFVCEAHSPELQLARPDIFRLGDPSLL